VVTWNGAVAMWWRRYWAPPTDLPPAPAGDRLSKSGRVWDGLILRLLILIGLGLDGYSSTLQNGIEKYIPHHSNGLSYFSTLQPVSRRVKSGSGVGEFAWTWLKS
jgi:hypothetical protein